MEAEAFPIRFTKGIRSYWRRRDYQRVDGSGAVSRGRRRHRLVRLGDGGGSRARPWAVRIGGMFRVQRHRGDRVQAPAPARAAAVAPMRVLGRIRDAYVDVMLGAAKTQPAAARALPTAAESLWQKRVPMRRSSSKAHQKADELGQRLVMEMYKSVLASRNLSGMLHASVAR
ncbi:hypothetical protein BAE44_0019693 [Dichanthelium oligosanthes]|uniref:Uncharacterized protein n=1 Tax=Dichanthelium oligosanthes TaxID=888268 RepID=A0A1E5V2H4_9POAL|nr:hypothetical protein BAE44_0019693 [Dichanthelium oligosanthes]